MYYNYIIDPKFRLYTTKFINDVFNYYNGKINTVINNAHLEIDWALNETSYITGNTTNTNRVTLFPSVICRLTNNMNMFKSLIVLTIIHELYHVDQFINYWLLKEDSQYRNQIEHIVELLTAEKLIRDAGLIKDKFDLYINKDVIFLNKLFGYDRSKLFYNRKTYETHILSILLDFNHGELYPLNMQLHDIFNNPFSNIQMDITDTLKSINTKFILKANTSCMPLDQLNSILNDQFFKYDYRGSYMEIEQYDFNNYNIAIRISTQHKLYNII